MRCVCALLLALLLLSNSCAEPCGYSLHPHAYPHAQCAFVRPRAGDPPLPPLPPQCCCTTGHSASGVQPRCLPSVIIVGAQKSGSTALFGYLLLHPNFAAPTRKEVHFFDVHRYFRTDAPAAAGGNADKSPRSYVYRYLQYFPEHSGHQISGEATPSYMLGFHSAERIANISSHSKIIVVLRNPVDRFYSEYQMMVRRVERQVDMQRDARVLRLALDACTGVPVDEKGLVLDWAACMLTPAGLGSFEPFAVLVRESTKKELMLQCLRGLWKNRTEVSLPVLGQCLMNPSFREKVGTLEEVVASEVEAIRTCTTGLSAHPTIRSHAPPDSAQLKDGSAVPYPLLTWGTPGCWPLGSNSGISKDFGFRGVYYPQLVRLLQFIPKENVLILEDNALRNQARHTLAVVFNFTGLPAMGSHFNFSSEVAYEKFTATFPTFESTTGWRMQSEYGAMPAGVRQTLRDMYTPHNEQLYSLLKRRFDWDDVKS